MELATQLLQAAFERLQGVSDETSAFNILSVLQAERYETRTHSRIIFFLLNSGRKEKNSFLRLFLQTIKIPQLFHSEVWNVYREKSFDNGSSRIDFALESKSFCAIIEMKVDAADGDSQLARYAAFGRKKRKEYAVYYLTLDGHMPEEQSVRGVDTDRLRCISFEREIASWLQKCMDSVEKDGYKYSFLKQYLGAVSQIAGINDEVVSVKDLLDSSDMARAAQLVAKSFSEKMNDVTECFFRKLCQKIERATKLETVSYRNCLDVYLKTFTKQGMRYHIILGIYIDTYLYAGFGFCAEDGYSFITLAEAEALFPAIYKEWMEKLEALENLPEFHQTKWEKWCYLEGPEGERLNFRDYSAQIKLIDEMGVQCRFIGSSLVDDLILPLLC